MADAMARVRGTTFSIGTTAATASTDTYTEIEKCKAVDGTFGQSWSSIDVTTIKDRFAQAMKGVADAGAITVGGPVMQESADGLAAGQAALKAAADDDSDPDIYNFKVVSTSGRILYLKARVMSFTRQFGQNSNVEEFRSQLKLQDIFTEAAT